MPAPSSPSSVAIARWWHSKLFLDEQAPLVTSAGVVAQVWRGGDWAAGPDRLSPEARACCRTGSRRGVHPRRMLGESRTADPVDAHVVLLARERGWSVLTSDARDLLAIDPTLVVEGI